MPLIECPGCASRMVNGMCPMCGFADSCYTVATVLERESIIAMGGELMHQFGVATVKESEVVSAAPFEKRDEVVTAFPTELIDCPACSNQLSETAINCPKCGFVLSSKVVTVQKQKRIKAERIGAWAQGIGFAIGLVVALLWLNASNRLEPSSTNSLAAYSTAQNVTYVDRGDFDSAATAHMQERLARLSRKYGLSEDLVAAKLLLKPAL